MIYYMTYGNANDIINEPFATLLWKYKKKLETRMERSVFVFDLV